MPGTLCIEVSMTNRLAIGFAAATFACAQTFEVATVKPANPARQGKGVRVAAQSFNAVNYTLEDFIKYAYNVHGSQIVGGPKWLDGDKYDVEAKFTENKPTVDQLRLMTQALLADRFRLSLHHDRKDIAVYALVAGKNGPKLRERHPDDGGPVGFNIALPNAPRIPGRNASMERLAAVLQVAVLDRPVIDQTGLAGIYDFNLAWKPDETQFDGQGGKGIWHGNPDDPDIFTAIQEQLGLRLEPRKVNMDVLVIDGAGKPGDN
jgi:uncharacterized protein (TIGR03435 family)